MRFNFCNVKNLNISDQCYSKVLQGFTDSIFIFTYSPENGYQIKFISSSVYKMFEFLPKNNSISTFIPLMKRIHPDDISAFYKSLTDYSENGKTWEIEFRAQLPERNLCWFKISATIEKQHDDGTLIFNGRISDISSVKNLEMKIQISEQRSNIAQEILDLGIWEWDIKANTMFHSAQSLKILELKSDEKLKNLKDFDQIIHPDDLENFHSALYEHLESKTSLFEIFYRIGTSTGEYKWILNKGRIFERDAKGSPTRVIGTYSAVSPFQEKMIKSTSEKEINKHLLIQYQKMFSNLNPLIKNLRSLIDGINLKRSKIENKTLLTDLINTSDHLEQTIKYLFQKN